MALTRRILIGAAAGAAASYPLVATHAAPQLNVALGAAAGAAFVAGLGRNRGARAETAMAGCALGVPLWLLVTCVGIPALGGRAPALTAGQMGAQFPALVGWSLYGALLGILAEALAAVADRIL